MKTSLSILLAALILYLGHDRTTNVRFVDDPVSSDKLTDDAFALPSLFDMRDQQGYALAPYIVIVGYDHQHHPSIQLHLPIDTQKSDTVLLNSQQLRYTPNKLYRLIDSYVVIQAHEKYDVDKHRIVGTLVCWLADTSGSFWIVRRAIDVSYAPPSVIKDKI